MDKTRIITEEELIYLHNFAKKKDIIYVDLRIELVDHLCELVEKRWLDNPDESFKDAFHVVYKSFGIFGFSEIADRHQKQMSKRYSFEIWSYFKKWFRLPRVVLTFAVFFGLLFIQRLIPSLGLTILVISGLILIASLMNSYNQYRSNKKIIGEQNVLMAGVYRGLFWYCYLPIQSIAWGGGSFWSLMVRNEIFPSLCFIITLIFVLGNHFLLKRAEIQLNKIKDFIPKPSA